MRAAVVTRFGGPEVFELTELPDPVPGPGQVAIDVTYAAVGLVDIYIRQGLYKDRAGLPQPPYVPGLEVAGTIRAVGDGVEGFQVGEPVVTLSGTGAEGGYASVTVADAAMTVSLDGTGIGPAAAVAAVPNAASAYAALTEVAHLKPGERVLVHGALGGLASAFPGVARTLGAASVTGTARGSSLAAARASALPYDEVVASEDLLAALGGQRFDVVIDPVGGQVRTDSLKVMAPLGRMLLVGNASGDWQHTVATNSLWLGSLAIAGFSSGYYFPAHPGQARPAAQGAINAISQGLVDIRTQIFPLAEVAQARRERLARRPDPTSTLIVSGDPSAKPWEPSCTEKRVCRLPARPTGEARFRIERDFPLRPASCGGAMPDILDQVNRLLHEVAETHHRVFRLVDGADDDWASWYSDWLVNLSELPALLETKPVRSELTYLLVSLDKEYTAKHPGQPWEAYYAQRILDHFGSAER